MTYRERITKQLLHASRSPLSFSFLSFFFFLIYSFDILHELI